MESAIKTTRARSAAYPMYFLGGTVLIIFLIINVWVGIYHFQSENGNRKQNAGALQGVKELAGQRAALLKARAESGAITLEMMQKAGVRLPDGFVRADEFASPWGLSEIRKEGTYLVWDFYEITPDGCTELLGNGGAIPGAIRVASSARAIDERAVPISRDFAARECKRVPLMARIILKQ